MICASKWDIHFITKQFNNEIWNLHCIKEFSKAWRYVGLFCVLFNGHSRDFDISMAKQKACYSRVARCLSDARRKMDEFLAMFEEKRRNMLDNYHSRSMKVTRAATKRCTYIGIIGPRHAILKSHYTDTVRFP